MIFTPKTEEEVSGVQQLLPDGVYKFKVASAKESMSKSGNPMIELKLEIITPENKSIYCFDYLLEAMAFKLRHFCTAVGLEEKYNAGSVTASDCRNKRGEAEIAIQLGSEKPTGGFYPDKNIVKDYKKDASISEQENSEFNDDIPF